MEENYKGKVIYPELSYKIVGILFEVWGEIGHSHKEKYIQRAIAKVLENKKEFSISDNICIFVLIRNL